MQCTKCGYPETSVVYTRSVDDDRNTERRRECMKCGGRFTTLEKKRDPKEKRIEIRE
jgi:transcriptional repressor NrdR